MAFFRRKLNKRNVITNTNRVRALLSLRGRTNVRTAENNVTATINAPRIKVMIARIMLIPDSAITEKSFSLRYANGLTHYIRLKERVTTILFDSLLEKVAHLG